MVYHVLKDGTITKDITGRIVKVSDAEGIYRLMTKINSRKDQVHKEVNEKYLAS